MKERTRVIRGGCEGGERVRALWVLGWMHRVGREGGYRNDLSGAIFGMARGGEVCMRYAGVWSWNQGIDVLMQNRTSTDRQHDCPANQSSHPPPSPHHPRTHPLSHNDTCSTPYIPRPLLPFPSTSHTVTSPSLRTFLLAVPNPSTPFS